MKRKLWLAAVLAAVLCTLSGCASIGTDIAAQLRPPKAMGEQGAAEEALGAYIADTLNRDDYTLKYPRSGEYRSAFLMVDVDGDGVKEAIAFYDAENDKSHVNLLRQSGDTWHSVNDLAVLSADIHRVTFGDMDGDGVQELMVCWDMFSDRTYQLTVYALNGNRITERFSTACAAMTVADLTADGKDDCLLLHSDAQAVTASLWSMSAGAVEEIGRCTVDSYVQRMNTLQAVSVGEDRQGVVLDCEKSGDIAVTQLLYWDNDRLIAPLYSETDGANLQTARPSDTPSGDFDEDGQWEWPQCSPLPGHETGNAHTSTCRLTRFYSWDMQQQEVIEKFACVFNAADRYYLLVDELFSEQFTTLYSDSDRTLWVQTQSSKEGNGDAVFAIRTRKAGDAPPVEVDGYTFTTLVQSGNVTYQVWYDADNPYAINNETLRYLLTVF